LFSNTVTATYSHNGQERTVKFHGFVLNATRGNSTVAIEYKTECSSLLFNQDAFARAEHNIIIQSFDATLVTAVTNSTGVFNGQEVVDVSSAYNKAHVIAEVSEVITNATTTFRLL
jgi:hypothetical protein